MELVKSKKRYLQTLRTLKRSENTISSYDLDLTALFRYLNSVNFDFSTNTINEYLNALEKKGASSNTIRRHALAIRGFLKYLNEKESSAYNLNEIFPKKRQEITPYIEERTEQLHAVNEPWSLAARLVARFGLGGEEVVRLRSNQIKVLEGGTILVTELRTINLTAQDQKLAEELIVYLKQVGERAFPFTKRLLEMKLKAFSESTGIKLSLRSLRHLAAKRLYLQNDPLIKDKLGLSSDYSLRAYEKFKVAQ